MNSEPIGHDPQSGQEVERHASWLELFFDLIFVLVVGRTAASLHSDLSATGFLDFALISLPLWWAWVGFSFYVSRFEDENNVVRGLMLVAMLAAAVLSTTVGGAFDGRTAVGFALSYAGLRTCLVVLYLRHRSDSGAAELVRFYVTGFGVAIALWVASAFVGDPARFVIWGAAFLIEAATPGLAGARLERGPTVHTGHLPERFGLFVIIVLGEAIVAIGGGLGDLSSSFRTDVVAATSFLLAAGIWWNYFDFAGKRAQRALAASDRPAAFARDVYSYGHLPIVVGIVAASVGAQDAIAHAGSGGVESGARWALAGGLALFLGALAVLSAFIDEHDSRDVAAPLLAVVGMVALAALGHPMAPVLFVGGLLALMVAQLVAHAFLSANLEAGAIARDP